ncbi:hypothetical protein HKX48_006324 [Thoreauomyces humboldtii]|nr:hypothetical protein HKX48_006324 [Thoreauomyces humboldtii]
MGAEQSQPKVKPAQPEMASSSNMNALAPTDVPTEGIKEWHMHLYWFQTNDQQKQEALAIRQAILDMAKKDPSFIAVPLATTNHQPRGPHPCGSFETWVPIESFAKVHAWFTMNRGELSVLIHPLTREEILDHTVRATWMGPSFPVDISTLNHKLDKTPAQYPELRKGYSAPA